MRFACAGCLSRATACRGALMRNSSVALYRLEWGHDEALAVSGNRQAESDSSNMDGRTTLGVLAEARQGTNTGGCEPVCILSMCV